MATYSQVYELAGVQDDPLAERVLALLFTDKPERPSVRPGDTRQHWQWFARTDTQNQGSRLWLNVDAPITDSSIVLMKSRAENALAPLLADRTATKIDVTVQQVAIDSVDLIVVIRRPNAEDLSLGVAISQGGG